MANISHTNHTQRRFYPRCTLYKVNNIQVTLQIYFIHDKANKIQNKAESIKNEVAIISCAFWWLNFVCIEANHTLNSDYESFLNH